MSYCSVTWEVVMEDPTIKSIQEPVCEHYVSKQDFHEGYHTFLITLDGRDCASYVDFFWQRCPGNSSCLEFVDGDARLDIYDFLRDEGLIPDMKRVHSGDWKFEKKEGASSKKKNKNKR